MLLWILFKNNHAVAYKDRYNRLNYLSTKVTVNGLYIGDIKDKHVSSTRQALLVIIGYYCALIRTKRASLWEGLV